MSLLSYSSPWTSDNTDRNDSNISRKRTPTLGGVNSIRKTVKVRPNYDSVTDQYGMYATVESDDKPTANTRGRQLPETFEDNMEKQTDRNTKINSILNKITSFSTDDKLGDFNPMPYPTNITKKNPEQIMPDERLKNGENPLMPKVVRSELTEPVPTKSSNPFHYRASEPSSSSSSSQYANYREAYGKEGLSGMAKEPYYSKMGISKGEGNDKVMDRLNYMVQMLESLQMEKTNHVTEEFVLYCLLGVFMIYIVDGFSRGGKYVR